MNFIADTITTKDSISQVVQDTLSRALTTQPVDTVSASGRSIGSVISSIGSTIWTFVQFLQDNPLVATVLFVAFVIIFYVLVRLFGGPKAWRFFTSPLRWIRKILLEAKGEEPSPGSIPPPLPPEKLPQYSGDPFPEPPKLFGREKDLEKLRKLLRDRKPPVVQLVGASGVGKTMLAAKAVDELFLDYVRLELHGESAEKVTELLYEIFIQQPVQQKSHAEIIGLIMEAWRQRGCLLVIDNLHCLLDDKANPKDEQAKLLLEKLGEASGGQLLTLSWSQTDVLGTGAEKVLKWELEGLREKPGVEKLRAEGVRGEPKITLEKVVDNLDGNPKMLEILAGLIKRHGGNATILDEHPSWIEDSMAPLRAMWNAIGPELQNVLSALCVFRRGRNAERLGRFLETKNIQQQLDALIKWGLAKSIDGARDYAPDHDLLRKIVKEQLDEKKLCEWHKLAADIWLEEGKDVGKDNIPTTIAEIQPLLEAGVHLAEAKEGTLLLNEVIARQCGDTEFHWIADRLGAWADLTTLFEQLVTFESNAALLAKHHHGLGNRFEARGDWDNALREYNAGLEILKESEDLKGLIGIRHQIGVVYIQKGDWDAALKEYKAIMKMCKNLNDQYRIAAVRHQIGVVYHHRGDWDEALQEYRISLEAFKKLGNQQGIAISNLRIGMLYQDKKDLVAALREYRASLEISNKIGYKRGIAETNEALGSLFTQMKQFEKALDHTLIALQLFGELGDPSVRNVLGNLALFRRDWGGENFDKAFAEKTGEEVPEELKKASEKAK
ncbi:tetratricopeptide repeat protein [bacterium]|nr:tetratricopeptide repeat protein [bacterium]